MDENAAQARQAVQLAMAGAVGIFDVSGIFGPDRQAEDRETEEDRKTED